MTCRLCDGSCGGANPGSYAASELRWLWEGLAAAADRRGDRGLTVGTTTVTAPDDVAARAAAAGLLDRRHIAAGQRLRVDLAALAERLAPLTPGAAAAHGVGRRLAARADAAAARACAETELRAQAVDLVRELADDSTWAALRRSGWVTRLLDADDASVLERAAAVIAHLPSTDAAVVDRRVLAQAAARDPHALDRGQPVGGLVLAVLAAAGRTPPSSTARDAWTSIGVAYDDITGGLSMVGVSPTGWAVPAGAVVTVPPRVLATCTWPAGRGRVYVTENPSVLSAAAECAQARVVCTLGTPSRLEVDALVRLAAAGWNLQVRADFDDAGLNHVAAILSAAARARPWRMGAADYLAGVERGPSTVTLRHDRLAATPWDPQLRTAMAAAGVAVYEEAFLEELLEDIAARPGRSSGRASAGGH